MNDKTIDIEIDKKIISSSQVINLEENKIIEKEKKEIENKSHLPKYVNYVIILDYSFPKEPPKLLLKTNVILLNT